MVPVLQLLLGLVLQIQLLSRLVLVLDLQQLLVLLTPDSYLLWLRLRRLAIAVQIHRRFRVRLLDAVLFADAVDFSIRDRVMWRFGVSSLSVKLAGKWSSDGEIIDSGILRRWFFCCW